MPTPEKKGMQPPLLLDWHYKAGGIDKADAKRRKLEKVKANFLKYVILNVVFLHSYSQENVNRHKEPVYVFAVKMLLKVSFLTSLTSYSNSYLRNYFKN